MPASSKDSWLRTFPKSTRNQIALLAELCKCSPRQVVIDAVHYKADQVMKRPAAFLKLHR